MNENFWVNYLKDFKKTGLIFQTLLFFSLQGIEGSILLRNSDGSFYLCPSKKDFYSPSTVQLTLRLAELGWLFNTIHGFIGKCIF